VSLFSSGCLNGDPLSASDYAAMQERCR
jgi:hypothetical protein